jgi:hypothetical protein
VRAETTTRPVKVPTVAGTAGPSVNGTAQNALRIVTNQIMVRTAAVRRVAAGEERSPTVSRRTGTEIVIARPSSATHLASIRSTRAGIEGAIGPPRVRTATPDSCMRTANPSSSP